MRKQLLDLGRRGAIAFDGQGGSETVHPSGKQADVLTERAKRRRERHWDRQWRWERQGRAPKLEIHTV